jgi:type II secretory pathway predicted ATPase ExeA
MEKTTYNRVSSETSDVVMGDFLQYWALERMPFPKLTPPENAYEDIRIKQNLKKLQQVLATGEIGVVVGDVGMGKSTFLDIFLSQISVSKCRIIHLPTPQSKPRELYRSIAEGMGIDTSLVVSNSMKVSNWLMHSYLESNRPNILVIDEAHILTPQSLNELRLLTNASVKHRPIVTLVLFGQPLLSSTLKSPGLTPFVQRIGVCLSMEGLNIEQTGKYIDWHLQIAGYKGEEIFPELTKKAIYRKTQGIPRMINRICLESLHESAINGTKVITESFFIQVCKNLAPLLSN